MITDLPASKYLSNQMCVFIAKAKKPFKNSVGNRVGTEIIDLVKNFPNFGKRATATNMMKLNA